MINNLLKMITPSLARVVGAFTLLAAVFWAGFVASSAFEARAPGLHVSQEEASELRSIAGDHRLIRQAKRGDSVVICSEGPKQLQIASKPQGNGSAPSPAVSSTVYLREAGWQLCSAYANGVIDARKYAELLSDLLTRP